MKKIGLQVGHMRIYYSFKWQKESITPQPWRFNDDRVGEYMTEIRIPSDTDVAEKRFMVDPLFHEIIKHLATKHETTIVTTLEAHRGMEISIGNKYIGIGDWTGPKEKDKENERERKVIIWSLLKKLITGVERVVEHLQ